MRALLTTLWALCVFNLGVGAQIRVLKPLLGLDWYMPVPADNPIDAERVAAGRALFFDTRLSSDGTLACASCHDPDRAFSDGRPVARGIGGATGTRSAPALLNRGYGRFFFWDGRAASLEQQVLEPIFNPKELGLSRAELEDRTGRPVEAVAAALASYVRTIRSGGSRFDRYTSGESGALSALEKRGLRLFRDQARCVRCHVGPSFTDEWFHNTGVAWRDGGFRNEGRFRVTGRAEDRGAFKTPTLREIARTAPYMHDGSIATLEKVIEFYDEGNRPNPNLDRELGPLGLSADERAALLAFLRSLSGQVREGT